MSGNKGWRLINWGQSHSKKNMAIAKSLWLCWEKSGKVKRKEGSRSKNQTRDRAVAIAIMQSIKGHLLF
jgi:hypothetical protein